MSAASENKKIKVGSKSDRVSNHQEVFEMRKEVLSYIGEKDEKKDVLPSKDKELRAKNFLKEDKQVKVNKKIKLTDEERNTVKEIIKPNVEKAVNIKEDKKEEKKENKRNEKEKINEMKEKIKKIKEKRISPLEVVCEPVGENEEKPKAKAKKMTKRESNSAVKKTENTLVKDKVNIKTTFKGQVALRLVKLIVFIGMVVFFAALVGGVIFLMV